MSIADLPLTIFEPPEPWRLSVAQYHAMAKQGILADDDRVELLEGLLVAKMTVSPAHHRERIECRTRCARGFPRATTWLRPLPSRC